MAVIGTDTDIWFVKLEFYYFIEWHILNLKEVSWKSYTLVISNTVLKILAISENISVEFLKKKKKSVPAIYGTLTDVRCFSL